MTKQELMQLGLTEADADKVLKEHVPYERFKEVNEAKKGLETQLGQKDADISKLNADIAQLNGELEGAKGDKLTIQDLQSKLSVAEENAKKTAKHNSIELELLKAHARNSKAAMALIDTSKVNLKDDGSLEGLSEAIEALKKSDAYLFAEAPRSQGFNPGAQNPSATAQGLQDGVAAFYKG